MSKVLKSLLGLSTFIGASVRRNVDPASLMQFMANRLQLSHSGDLIVLREILRASTGLEPLTDMPEHLVHAYTGGPCLRKAALLATTRDTQGKAPSYNKSSTKLMQALQSYNLTVPIMILIAQLRENFVYRLPDAQAHTKHLGNILDEVCMPSCSIILTDQAIESRSVLSISGILAISTRSSVLFKHDAFIPGDVYSTGTLHTDRVSDAEAQTHIFDFSNRTGADRGADKL